MLVELDGEFWHSKKKQINRDILKTNAAYDQKFLFCRLSSDDLNFNMIYKSSEELKLHNHNIINNRLSKHL